MRQMWEKVGKWLGFLQNKEKRKERRSVNLIRRCMMVLGKGLFSPGLHEDRCLAPLGRKELGAAIRFLRLVFLRVL